VFVRLTHRRTLFVNVRCSPEMFASSIEPGIMQQQQIGGVEYRHARSTTFSIQDRCGAAAAPPARTEAINCPSNCWSEARHHRFMRKLSAPSLNDQASPSPLGSPWEAGRGRFGLPALPECRLSHRSRPPHGPSIHARSQEAAGGKNRASRPALVTRPRASPGKYPDRRNSWLSANFGEMQRPDLPVS
jgi:hypothetical protein